MKKLKLKQEVKDAIEIAFVMFIFMSILFIGLEGMRISAKNYNNQQKMTESVAMKQSK